MDAVADAMHLLADKTRLKILLMLGEGEANVTDLCQRLGCPQPTASHHLGLLRMARLVEAHRDGRQIFYRLTTPPGTAAIHVAARGSTIEVELSKPAAEG